MSTSMMVGRSISIFSLLVITVRNMWFFCCLFCFSFLWLFCSMQSQSSPLSLIWKGLLLSEIFSTFTTSSPRPVAAPKYFISLYISFTFPYLLLKRHAWLSGNLGPVNSIHNFFFPGSSLMCSWSLENLLGREWSLPPFPLIFWN